MLVFDDRRTVAFHHDIHEKSIQEVRSESPDHERSACEDGGGVVSNDPFFSVEEEFQWYAKHLFYFVWIGFEVLLQVFEFA